MHVLSVLWNPFLIFSGHALVSSSNSFISLAMPFCTKIKMNKNWWLLSFCRYKTFGAMPVQTELYIYSHSRSVQTHCILKLGRATPSRIEAIGPWLRLESKDVPFVPSRDFLRASIHFRINPFLAPPKLWRHRDRTQKESGLWGQDWLSGCHVFKQYKQRHTALASPFVCLVYQQKW